MYGHLHTVDLSFLLGQTVEQVCLGQHQTQLRTKDASILIECKHSLLIPEENREIVWERSVFPSDGISKLLSQAVSSASFIAERTLELSFASGIQLLVVVKLRRSKFSAGTCGLSSERRPIPHAAPRVSV